MSSAPRRYVAVGHVTVDIDADGSRRAGGTVLYAARVAEALGWRPFVVTAHGPDHEACALGGLETRALPSPSSTVFHNRYRGGSRVQHISSEAAALCPEILAGTPLAGAIVHLAPVAGEVAPEIADLAVREGSALVGLTPQGWMRERRGDGLVRFRPWEPTDRTVEAASAVVFSEEDLGGDHDGAVALARRFEVALVSRGGRPAQLFVRGRPRLVTVSPVIAEPLDPTGAGDILAATFFIALAEGATPENAAAAAVTLATASVQQVGLRGIPRREEARRTLEAALRRSAAARRASRRSC